MGPRILEAGQLPIKGVVLRAIAAPDLRESALDAVRTDGPSLGMRGEEPQRAEAIRGA